MTAAKQTRITRDFEVYMTGRDQPLKFAGKARSEVDGMGVRIYNHDGTIAFTGATSCTVVETNSAEEKY